MELRSLALLIFRFIFRWHIEPILNHRIENQRLQQHKIQPEIPNFFAEITSECSFVCSYFSREKWSETASAFIVINGPIILGLDFFLNWPRNAFFLFLSVTEFLFQLDQYNT